MTQNSCRVCLQNIQPKDVHVSLFSSLGERTIAATFAELCGIVIHAGDDLPKNACVTCVESVVMANAVRQKCIESDRRLREMIPSARVDRKRGELAAVCHPKRERTDHDDDGVGFDGMDDFSQNMYTVGANSMMLEEKSADLYLPHTALMPRAGQEQILPEGFLEILNSSARPAGGPSDAPKSCCGCELSFQTESALHEHSLAAHYSERVICNAKPYECGVCFKRFTDESGLTLHGNTRSLCHRCRFCEKRFNDRRQLQFHEKYHRRIVRPDEACECNLCGRSFRFRSSLKTHAQLHTVETNDRLHKCSQCERRFLRPTHLRSHEISHSSETPFGCGLCAQKFKRKQHLTAHLRIHGRNDKTYKCRHCELAFMHQSTRAYHEVSKHTGNYPFSCDLCGRNFFRRPLYDKHMARHNLE